MTAAPVHSWCRPLPAAVRDVVERLASCDGVRHVAVMPDAHWAGDVCVGTVLGTDRTLYPGAVGGDVGCGMAAVAFHGAPQPEVDAARAAALLVGLGRAIPPARHRRSSAPRVPDTLRQRRLSHPRLDAAARAAEEQFATLGSGNHFVELQRDELGRLWLMLHSGSRAVGQAVRDHHLAHARAGGHGLKCLDAESAEGRAYLHDMEWACAWAEASRRAMLWSAAALVEEHLGVARDPDTVVTCHHNDVREEEHGGARLLVHRKGAIAAHAGVPGLVPGSMGTRSFHVVGLGHPGALCSSAHGAGREWGRGEARRRISTRELARQMRGVFFDHRLADRLRDEAPGAYKDVGAVVRAQAELARVTRVLRPLLVYKGS